MNHMARSAKSRQHRLLVELLFRYGLRISEALHVRARDVYVGRPSEPLSSYIKVIGKGKKQRRVELEQGMAETLVSGAAGTYIFGNPSTGRPRSIKWANTVLKRLRGEGGASTHYGRHFAITEALGAGAPIAEVSRSMGHADCKTTYEYTNRREGEGAVRFIDPLDNPVGE